MVIGPSELLALMSTVGGATQARMITGMTKTKTAKAITKNFCLFNIFLIFIIFFILFG
jgi:hypothetical protein